jgi:hypothetical protein
MYRIVVLTRKNQERSGSHCHWITEQGPNPDRALFFSGFPDASQKLVFLFITCCKNIYISLPKVIKKS